MMTFEGRPHAEEQSMSEAAAGVDDVEAAVDFIEGGWGGADSVAGADVALVTGVFSANTMGSAITAARGVKTSKAGHFMMFLK